MTDRRRDLLISAMGLGPAWVLRDRAAEAQPPVRSSVPLHQGAGRGADSARMANTPESPRKPADDAVLPDDAEREEAIRNMSWMQLRQAVANCSACGLCKTRKNTVFGVGDEAAQWMIVGEAPGAEEDARGEPFVGQAGRLLDNMLASLELTRANKVYIANVLKCRPPGNRNPEALEVARCSPHLERQVELIQPKLILALGRFAAQTLLQSQASIASLRGQVHQYRGVPLIVSYHPAYLLRNLPDKARAWEDLVFALQTMAGATRDAAP